jgi:hypothetical protein
MQAEGCGMLGSLEEDRSMVAGKLVVMDGRRIWEGGGNLALLIPAQLSKLLWTYLLPN